MASRGVHAGFVDTFHNGRKKHDSNKESFTWEFHVVKDNRTKQKEDGDTVPETFKNGDSISEQAVANVKRQIAHDKDVKSSGVQKMEQSEGRQTTFVGSHAVREKSNQNRVVTMASGKTNFAGELCCSSSDPIHVPSLGSKSAGTFGAIKREIGVVGARQQPSDSVATNTSTSNSLVKGTLASKDKTSNEQQSGFPSLSLKNTRVNSPVSANNLSLPSSQHHLKPQNHVNQTKVNPHLEWKPRSVSAGSIKR
ncbi:hypothetical protein ACP4OV_012338 [Aristida adscensionis]